ncbi:MAG TPA: methyl-accepting chemotaxis protein [Rhodocyclaceae bacterium]|nr:methyl-accepting chemotaxis protein [Rhodocyclaceae bacterium]
MLDRLKLRSRLIIVVCAAFLGMLTIVMGSAHDAKDNLLESRKQLIRSGVQGIHNIVAFYYGEETAGRLTRDEAQRLAKEAIRRARYGGEDGKTEYYYAWTLEGVGVAHVKTEFEGKNMLDKIKDGQGRYTIKDIIAALASKPEAFVDGAFTRPGGTVPVPKLLFVKKFEPWQWLVGTGVYLDDLDQLYWEQLVRLISLSLVPTLLIGLLSVAISRSIFKEIGGEPAVAAAIMKKVSEGDLTIDSAVGAAPGSLLSMLGTMVSSLRHLVTEITSDSVRLVHSATTISLAARDVSSAADQQAEAHSAMAAAIQELTVSSNHISDSAGDTQRDSLSAVELSSQGSERVSMAAAAMEGISRTVSDASGRIRELESHATQISSIANVIKDIAGQTNLLALNAAIEAARAGEQGRGFAVVADEVRKLAERTSLATTEIEQMITGIQSETVKAAEVMDAAIPEVAEGVKLAASATELLHTIESGARRTLDRIGDVAGATREQSSASTSIAQRVEQIAMMVEATTASMHGTAQTARELEGIAKNLQALVEHFRV